MTKATKDETPAGVRGLKFKVDNRYSYVVYGQEIVLVDAQSYHATNVKMSFGQARRYVAAVLALLEACGEIEDLPPVEVVNDELERAIKFAEMKVTESDRARSELAEMIEAAKVKTVKGSN